MLGDPVTLSHSLVSDISKPEWNTKAASADWMVASPTPRNSTSARTIATRYFNLYSHQLSGIGYLLNRVRKFSSLSGVSKSSRL